MAERLPGGTKESRRRGTPFLRTNLSWLEGVRIDNGEKSVRIRALWGNRISVMEIVNGVAKEPDVFSLPVDETYQHEIEEGKTIYVTGGEVRGRRRKFGFTLPPDFDIKKLVRKAD